MILVELVPRDDKVFKAEAENVASFSQVSGINVPDVLRLPTRSYDAVGQLLEMGIDGVPHIRCIDNPVEKTVDIISKLVDQGLKRVLLISGDAPTNISAKTYPVTTVEAIDAVKKRHPNLKVYGALDPYRTSFKKELQYCNAKKRAGADGFFSQPFFDPDLARIYAEQLEGSELFMGISPVTSENSLNYWKTRNNVIFPKRFKTTLVFNCELGKEIVNIARAHNQNVYLMPIKTPVIEYLTKLFN